MGGRKLVRGAAIVLALTLGVAGCSGGGESPSESVTESTTTAPPTLAPTAPASVEPTTETTGPPPLTWEPEPTKPAELSEWNEVGAEAFVHYAVEVLNYAQKFNKPELVDAISDPECVFCASTMDRLAAMDDAGQRRLGGEMSFSVKSIAFQDASGLYFIDGVIETQKFTDYVDDRMVAEGDGGFGDIGFAVGLEDGVWLLFQAGGTRDA